jgi:DNA/RNA-binding protein KIN17
MLAASVVGSVLSKAEAEPNRGDHYSALRQVPMSRASTQHTHFQLLCASHIVYNNTTTNTRPNTHDTLFPLRHTLDVYRLQAWAVLRQEVRNGSQIRCGRKVFKDCAGGARYVLTRHARFRRTSANSRAIQACQKQCRDANGFKCHVQSESHVRQMAVVGEDPRKYINGFSTDFQRDFVSLLRTAHGEKWISANKFYNEYIRDKEHVHMNATKWNSLAEFTKYLGREGICHVKEDEKDGLVIAWRDTSIAAVKRKEEIAELEAAEARSGAGEDKMLKRMAKRAQEEAEAKKAIEAKRAAAAASMSQKENTTPPAEGTSSTDEKKVDSPVDDVNNTGEKKESAEPKAEAAPVKLSFGMKAKVPLPNKAGLGQMKSQSIFKRKKDDTLDQKPVKKVKL